MRQVGFRTLPEEVPQERFDLLTKRDPVFRNDRFVGVPSSWFVGVPSSRFVNSNDLRDPGAALARVNNVSAWHLRNRVRTIATMLAAAAYPGALASSTGNLVAVNPSNGSPGQKVSGSRRWRGPCG